MSVPIDTNGDGGWDVFAFIDAVGCTDGTTSAGTVDVVANTSCTVSFLNGETYANWAAYVAAHPEYKFATDTIPFVVVDQPGEFTLSNVVIGAVEAGDVTAPTAPVAIGSTNPVVACGAATNSSTVLVGWTASTDDVAVNKYEYQVMTPLRDTWEEAWPTTLYTTSYAGGFTEGEGDYTYRVRAVDAAGNESAWSNECMLTYDTTLEASSKEACKNNGWKALYTADNKTFKNQGQCVAYVMSSENSRHNQ